MESGDSAVLLHLLGFLSSEPTYVKNDLCSSMIKSAASNHSLCSSAVILDQPLDFIVELF
jgi:hypothetical protein